MSTIPISNGGGGGVSNPVSMVPFFHFYGGDHLLFKAWQPQSGRAIAGACVGLFVFAIFERWVSAMSSALVLQWKQRYFSHTLRYPQKTEHARRSLRTQTPTQKTSSEASSTKRRTLPLRTIPPFNAKVDLLRGLLYAFRSLLGYTFMLVVM